MNNLTDLLNTHYQAIEKEEDYQSLFLAVKDYAQLIDEAPALKSIGDDLLKQESAQYKYLETLEQLVTFDLEKARNGIKEIIDNNNIKSESISRELENYDLYKNRRASSSRGHIMEMEYSLHNIFFELSTLGYRLESTEFLMSETVFHQSQNGEWVLSKNLISYYEQKQSIDQSEKIELWSIYLSLIVIKLAVLGKDNLTKEGFSSLRTLQQIEDDTVKLFFAKDDWAKIIINNVDYDGFDPRPLLKIMDKKSVKSGMARLHNYLLKEFAKQPLQSPAVSKQQTESLVQLFISRDEGVYRNLDGQKLAYPISGKRANLVWSLRGSKQTGPDLSLLLNQASNLITQEIKGINEHFAKKLKLKDKLIVHLPAGGYKLNTEKYHIDFIDPTT